MKNITKKNMLEVARELKGIAKDMENKQGYDEIALVFNKKNELSLLDTFSAKEIDKKYFVDIIQMDNVKKINEYIEIIQESLNNLNNNY